MLRLRVGDSIVVPKRKVLIIKIPPLARQNLETFLQRLEKVIYGDTIVGSIQGDTIRIYFYGGKLAYEKTLMEIKKLLREYTLPKKPGGLKSYSIKNLSREARTALPSDVLKALLEVKGYRAKIENDRIETNADPDTIYGLAVSLGESLRKLRFFEATRTGKKLVSALIALEPSIDPSRIISIGENLGILKIDDKGKVIVSGDWRKALKILYDRLVIEGE